MRICDMDRNAAQQAAQAFQANYYEQKERADDLQKIVDQLPKCWRLRDGKRVQDVPVVPGMNLFYDLGNSNGPWPCGVVRIGERQDDGPDWPLVVRGMDGRECSAHAGAFCDSREAAEAQGGA